MKSLLRYAFACASFLVAASAMAQIKIDYVGLEAGVLLPSSGKIRDKFGSNVLRLGLTPVLNRRTPDWKPSFEIGFMGATSSTDRFSVFPATVGIQKSFGNADLSVVPYVRAGVGLAYFDYNIDGVKNRQVGGAGVAEFGWIGGDRFKMSVKTYILSKQDGIDFGGVLVSLAYGIFKI